MTPDEALDLLDRCYHSPATNVVRAEVERLRATLNDHLQSESAETMRADRAEAKLAAAQALLKEAQAYVVPDSGWDYDKGGYLFDRIDAALAGEKK